MSVIAAQKVNVPVSNHFKAAADILLKLRESQSRMIELQNKLSGDTEIMGSSLLDMEERFEELRQVMSKKDYISKLVQLRESIDFAVNMMGGAEK